MDLYYKTFVSVGNGKQPFLRLLNAVISQISHLPKPILIQRGNTLFEFDNCIIKDFLPMNAFINYINKADVVIIHGGAGSIIHAIKAGKIPIVMPRRQEFGEIINNHQIHFCTSLHSDNKVIMIESELELYLAIKNNSVSQQITLNKENNEAYYILQKIISTIL